MMVYRPNSDEPNPDRSDFVIVSPWVGKVHYFTREGEYYKRVLLPGEDESLTDLAHKVPRILYDAAYTQYLDQQKTG